MDKNLAIPTQIYRHYSLASKEVGKSSGRFLDYGCGDGSFLGQLDRSGKQLFGFDINPEAIVFAKKNYPHINFKTLKVGQKPPYPDNYFEGIFMFHVLEHVDSEEQAIKEVYRMMKPGGKLYLSSPYKGLFHWADAANIRFRYPKIHKFIVELFLGRDVYVKRFIISKKNKMFGDCSINRTWHSHYQHDQITQFLKGKFTISKFIKYSMFQPFILLYFNLFYVVLKIDNSLAKWLIILDNYIPAGELSYTFFIVAKKK